ncbi:MAG: polyprenyl synthetase family protein [Ignavibacteriales bacterium]|nr:MAG: polyprenyl synthetase family protein [Ignavibacteriales bacterium]
MREQNSRFKESYEKERNKINSLLKKCLAGKKPDSLYSPGSYILDGGGKRLRPILVLFSAKAVGGRSSKVYNASLAVELLHNFTLVHDDIMDNADKRRGRLTLHKKYDTNTAILVGDSLLSIAYELLLKDCNGKTKEVMSAFTTGLIEICEGQSMDKDFETLQSVSLNDYLVMITKKTAAMAEMCCTIGGLLGGGSDKEVAALASYGKNIGIAFQIQDDLLDILGDEKALGKKIGGDLIEGKKTYLFLKALEKSKGKDRTKLQNVIRNKGISGLEVLEYKNLYEKLGITVDAKKDIKKYTTKALSKLKFLRSKSDQEFFEWLAHSLINRIS